MYTTLKKNSPSQKFIRKKLCCKQLYIATLRIRVITIIWTVFYFYFIFYVPNALIIVLNKTIKFSKFTVEAISLSEFIIFENLDIAQKLSPTRSPKKVVNCQYCLLLPIVCKIVI